MKKKQLTTEKRLGVQLYLVLFLYTVTGIGLEILAQFIFPILSFFCYLFA